MQVAAEDLHPDAAIQYLALYLIEDLNRKGQIDGHLPKHLLDPVERKVVNDLIRAGLARWTDIELEGAVVAAVFQLREAGYDIKVSTRKAMKVLKGVR